MAAARAVLFDFNGTPSQNEPVQCAIHQELIAEHGRALTRDECFGRYAGLSDEEIVGVGLGLDGTRRREVVAERMERYVTRAADGGTVPESVRDAVRHAAAHVTAVEDTEAGVASATAAGLRCAAVLGTIPRERLRAADEIVERVDVETVRWLLA